MQADVTTSNSPVTIDRRAIWAIAIPAMATNVATALIGVGDMWIVGQLGSASTQGAVDIGARLFAMLFVVMNFLKTGTTGLVAQAMTRSDGDSASNVLLRGVAVASAIAIALLLSKPMLLPVLLDVLGARGETLTAARIYAEIRYWSAPAVLVNYAMIGFLVGQRRMGTVLIIEVGYNFVNVALGAWLCLALDWGIAGIGWSSALAEGGKLAVLGFVVGLQLRRSGGFAFPGLTDLAPARLRPFLAVNRDLFLRTMILMLALAALTRLSAERGPVVLAANGIYYQLFLVIALLLDGFENAGQVLGGERTGASDRAGLRAYARAITARALGTGLVLSGMFLMFGSEVAGWFAATEAVADYAREYAVWLAVLPLAGAAGFALDGILVGASWTRVLLGVMIGTAAAYAGLLWLTWPLGNAGLWLSFTVFLSLRGIAQGWIVHRRTVPAG